MNALSPQPTRQDLLGMIAALSERVTVLERICLPENTGAVAASRKPVFRDVVAAVAEAHGISATDMMDMKRRDSDRIHARWAAWLALSADHGWSASKIARRFNCDHTTVLNGLRRAKELWGAK